MYIIYKFFTFIIYPFLIVYLNIRVKKKKECPIRFKEKLGFSKYHNIENTIWFHASSLGEIKSILPFIKHYGEGKKNNILITTVTLSSSAFFDEEIKSNNIFHQFAPLDSPIIIKKFLKKWKPKLSIFVESELWPNMITETSKNSKVILLNARISKKSFIKWKFFKKTFSKLMNKFSIILCQNLETFNYLKYFSLKNMSYIGNIKLIDSEKKIPNYITFSEKFNSWSAMSIHFEEIDIIIETHKKINKEKDFTTFLIPRHLDKVDLILQKIKNHNIKVQRISKNSEVKKFNGIVLIDKFGIADDIFNISKIVFMGGSFIDHGGQNPIEPVKYGCHILHGKYIYNFTEIYELLNQNNLSKIILNQNELVKEILKLSMNNKKVKINSLHNLLGKKIFMETQKILDQLI